MCGNCHATFYQPSEVGKHFKRNQTCHAEWISVQLRQNLNVNRVGISIDQNCALLEELKDLENKKVPLAQSVLAIMHPKNRTEKYFPLDYILFAIKIYT